MITVSEIPIKYNELNNHLKVMSLMAEDIADIKSVKFRGWPSK